MGTLNLKEALEQVERQTSGLMPANACYALFEAASRSIEALERTCDNLAVVIASRDELIVKLQSRIEALEATLGKAREEADNWMEQIRQRKVQDDE